jgi:hypothetical protein
MPMIDDAVVPATETATVDDVKSAIARHAWLWFYSHANDVLIRRKIVFWQVAIYLRDLYPLFVTLFGDPDR